MKNQKAILKLKMNRFFFNWYYKRVPKFFNQWCILKSLSLLRQNYEHKDYIIKGNNEVISNAIKRESEMRTEISNLKLKLMGVSQDTISPLNQMLGTNLKGKSNSERDN